MTGAEVLRAIRRDGWEIVRWNGTSHVQLKHPSKPGLVTVTIHAGKIVGPGLLARIIWSAGLTPDESRGLL